MKYALEYQIIKGKWYRHGTYADVLIADRAMFHLSNLPIYRGWPMRVRKVKR